MADGLAAAGFYHWRTGFSARFNRCVRRNGNGDQKPDAELCNLRRTVLLYRSWWPALCPHVHRQRCGKRKGHGDRIHLPAAAHQIGRASCRARVCQSVSMSVDAESLTKKETLIVY